MSEIIGRTYHQMFLIEAQTNSALQNKELRSSKIQKHLSPAIVDASPAIVDASPAIVDITKRVSIRIKSKEGPGSYLDGLLPKQI
ncbi:MAG: hypothetical protein KKA35_01795 [Proteobacteria bacterium]|nr:hypothetical protein [Pseudomonadota bacterium]